MDVFEVFNIKCPLFLSYSCHVQSAGNRSNSEVVGGVRMKRQRGTVGLEGKLQERCLLSGAASSCCHLVTGNNFLLVLQRCVLFLLGSGEKPVAR